MQKLLCAAFDKQTGLYDPPFAVRHANEALREWKYLKTDTNTKFGKHPADWDLYQLGTFDDETGALEAENPTVIKENS